MSIIGNPFTSSFSQNNEDIICCSMFYSGDIYNRALSKFISSATDNQFCKIIRLDNISRLPNLIRNVPAIYFNQGGKYNYNFTFQRPQAINVGYSVKFLQATFYLYKAIGTSADSYQILQQTSATESATVTSSTGLIQLNGTNVQFHSNDIIYVGFSTSSSIDSNTLPYGVMMDITKV